jgi:uncharacterized RDD family membrane protein YckC
MTAPGVPYAGIATRAVALAIDVLIVHVIVLFCAAVFALVASLVGGVHLGVIGELIAAAAWLLSVAFYFVLFWSTAGQTPGMRLMDLRVTTRLGVHPGIVRSVVRIIGLGLAIIPLFAGFIPVLLDARRRALQDFLAGTVVVYGAGEPPPAPEPAAVAVVGDVQPSG